MVAINRDREFNIFAERVKTELVDSSTESYIPSNYMIALFESWGNMVNSLMIAYQVHSGQGNIGESSKIRGVLEDFGYNVDDYLREE